MKLITIILILCLFVGGASANTISFNAVTNVITVIGFNATHPCTFLDVYNADVAGGWGKVNQVTPWCYHIDHACFYLGNATHPGYFGDVGKQIILKMPAYQTYVFNALAGKGYLEFGEIDNVTLKTTKNGCDFTFEGGSTYASADFCVNPVELYLYGCKIQMTTDVVSSRLWLENTNGSIWQTHLNNGFYLFKIARELDIYDITISNSGVTSYTFGTNIPINKMNCYNVRYGIALFQASSTTINMVVTNCEYLFWFMAPAGDHYLIDCNFEWHKPCAYWGTGYKVLRQYTLNLQTTPHAKITIMNYTDVVYQGYAYDNGSLEEQVLTMGYYTSTTASTLNSHNPYSIEIKKVGYHTYAQEFTLDEPIKWHILLLPDRVQVGSDIIRPSRRS